MMNGPTHQGGRTLDLVLTSAESLVTDISVAGQHAVCHSDHYAITFRMKSRAEKLIKKRIALNFKKANWEGLIKALNSVKWDKKFAIMSQKLHGKISKYVVLASLVEKFIPSVTIKENNHPPWFDDESFKMHKRKVGSGKSIKNLI
jgi:hypothetical protein